KDDNFPSPPDNAHHPQKACYVQDVRDHRAGANLGAAEGGPGAGFTKCAEHGQRCQFRGTAYVAYGRPGGPFTYKDAVSNGIDCDDRGFPVDRPDSKPGKDQEYLQRDNVCYMKLREPPTPTPTQKPPPTNTPVWKMPNTRDHR